MEIDCISDIISSLTLAKELYDIDRFEIVRGQFEDELVVDSYYENIMAVCTSLFSEHYSCYDDEAQFMAFCDNSISDYFIYAAKYGKRHKLTHDKNPLVEEAQKFVARWLNGSCCVEWRLLCNTKSKKRARNSELHLLVHDGCGNCFPLEGGAYGLIQIYKWFKEKCEEFKVAKSVGKKPRRKTKKTHAKFLAPEEVAA